MPKWSFRLSSDAFASDSKSPFLPAGSGVSHSLKSHKIIIFYSCHDEWRYRFVLWFGHFTAAQVL